MTILALASDYDGTIADDGVTAASTIAALRRWKASGRKLILVSGRHLDDLKQVLPELGLFDIAVLENGGLLYFPSMDMVRTLAPPPPTAFVERLRPRNLPEFAVGRTIVATKATEEAIVREAIDALGLDLEVSQHRRADGAALRHRQSLRPRGRPRRTRPARSLRRGHRRRRE